MNDKAERLASAIKIPHTLTDRQVALAKQFVQARMMDGFSVGAFCKENGMSTATWYKWSEDDAFKAYLNELSDAIVPTDEKEAYSKIKKLIMKIAEKENPSIKEIELFTDTFSYVVEADRRERMQALGLGATPSADVVSVEERKASLLSKLKG